MVPPTSVWSLLRLIQIDNLDKVNTKIMMSDDGILMLKSI